MKKLLLLVAILCFAGKAICKISRRELKAAKVHYLHDKNAYEHCLKDNTGIWYSEKDKKYYSVEYIENTPAYKTAFISPDIVQMDSLTYEGCKAIWHDQHIPKFMRRN